MIFAHFFLNESNDVKNGIRFQICNFMCKMELNSRFDKFFKMVLKARFAQLRKKRTFA
jgi:hypothetical protein